ncbi:MAG: hypothetical protein DMG01_24750, partial [Acidobacteria bacterium]
MVEQRSVGSTPTRRCRNSRRCLAVCRSSIIRSRAAVSSNQRTNLAQRAANVEAKRYEITRRISVDPLECISGSHHGHCCRTAAFRRRNRWRRSRILGNGSSDSVPHVRPVRVSGDVKFTNVVGGFTHTCGIARDGAALCWGANDSAQLGDGTVKPSFIPMHVATDIRFQMIGPGGGHTCAVSVEGIGYCWGGNWHGQLGVGNRDGDPAAPCCYRRPTRIHTDLRFRTVVAAGISSCGVAVDGKAYCWGSPQEGRLGTGAADAAIKWGDKTVPTAVSGDVIFATVIPRAWHTCGLSSTR